jgi:hypothetical protein
MNSPGVSFPPASVEGGNSEDAAMNREQNQLLSVNTMLTVIMARIISIVWILDTAPTCTASTV